MCDKFKLTSKVLLSLSTSIDFNVPILVHVTEPFPGLLPLSWPLQFILNNCSQSELSRAQSSPVILCVKHFCTCNLD